MLNIGDYAPDFTLPNQAGHHITLSQFRKRKVILFSFPMAGSIGCTLQVCKFREEMPNFTHLNAVILGISSDAPGALAQFKKRHHLSYDLLSDQDRQILQRYGAYGGKIFNILPNPLTSRSLWVIDENGVIIDQKINVGVFESVNKSLDAIRESEVRRS